MNKNELTNEIVSKLHAVVAQCTGDEAYFLLDQIIAEAQHLQDECDIIRHFRNDGDE